MLNFLVNIALGLVLSLVSYRGVQQRERDLGSLEDKIAKAESGAELGKLYGTYWFRNFQVHWFGDFKTVAITETGGRLYGFVGPKETTTVGARFFAGMHLVFCQAPIDAVSALMFDDDVAWEGRPDGDGNIIVQARTLFGGDSSEGGVSGTINYLSGEPTQEPNDYLKNVIPTETGFFTQAERSLAGYSDNLGLIPAFRGSVGVVLRQLWLGNTGNIRNMRWKGTNVLNTFGNWLPELAPINSEVGYNRSAVHLVLDDSGSMAGSRFTNQNTAAKNFLDSLVGSEQLALRIETLNGSSFEAIPAESSDITTAKAFIDGLVASGDTDYNAGVDGAGTFFADADSALVGNVVSTSYDGAASDNIVDSGGYVGPAPLRRVIVFLSDGGANPVGSDVTAKATIDLIEPTPEVFAVGIEGVGDLVTIDTDGLIPVITSAADADDFLTVISGPFGEFTDLNPAHIIRDVLISPTSDGSGDTAEIGASFATAAQLFVDEGFGLSLFWNDTGDKRSFIETLEEHTDSVVYRDRQTGVWEINPIRKLATTAGLFTFDDTIIEKWLDVEHPQQFDLPNQITLVYTDRSNGEPESITMTNNAAVQESATGRIVNEKVEFRGITWPDLASKVCARELAARTRPVSRGAIEVAYAPSALNLGDAIIVNEPKNDFNNMVCRVTEIEENTQSDGTIIVRFAEDIASEDLTIAGILGKEEGNAQPSAAALPSPTVVAEELAYIDHVEKDGKAAIDASLTTDAGFGQWAIGGSYPNNIHIGAVPIRFDDPNWIRLGEGNLSPAWVLDADMDTAADTTAFTATFTGREDEVAVNDVVQIDQERMRVDSIAYDSLTSQVTFTVGRGVHDTQPRAHLAGAGAIVCRPFMFVDGATYTNTDNITARWLPQTASTELSVAGATDQTVDFDDRAIRPYGVHNLRVGSEYIPTGLQTGTITLNWNHNDRNEGLTDPFPDHTETGVSAPETNTEYFTVAQEVDIDGVVLNEVETAVSPVTALTEDLTIPASFVADTETFFVGVRAKRDGYTNWQDALTPVEVLLPPVLLSLTEIDLGGGLFNNLEVNGGNATAGGNFTFDGGTATVTTNEILDGGSA